MSEPRRLTVALGERSYDILIGPGLLARVGEYVGTPEIIAVVSDAAVESLHGDRLRAGLSSAHARVERFTIEPGETSKSIEAADALWRWLASIGAHRSDVVVALGGGVVGDLAGFVAATYHRGIPFVQVPTTLLGMVDAAIGGKTAIDLPEGKNLVGAFHQPRAVIADTSVLQTLPEPTFATGMAEVIKHGFISSSGLHDWLRASRDAIAARDETTLATMVEHAAAVKVAVVEADETEHGARLFLNYGHTLAHALESLASYQGLTHGEAVAIGMMFAANLGARLGYTDLVEDHREALDAAGLPTGGVTNDFDAVAAAMQTDKKYDRGMRFVVLESLGKPTVVRDVPESALREAFEALR